MKTKILTNEQLFTVTAALVQLLRSGISLGDACTLLAEDELDAGLRTVWRSMASQADAGAGLSRVLESAGCFPSYARGLIAVGERVGKTEQTLEALSRYYAGMDRLERQLRSALLYPAMLMLVLLAVAVILLVWVLPVFNDVYAQLGGSLTGIAGGLLALGEILRKLLPGICLVLAVLAAVLAVTPVRQQILGLWNRVLGDRGAHRKVLSARFVQALEMALSSGMTDEEAVMLASGLAREENPAFRRRCDSCVAAVESGVDLSQALQVGDFLSVSNRRLLEAGIRSGSRDRVLEQIAQRMLEEGEEAVARQTGYAEPILIAVACVLVGAVLLSVMLPLMQIMTAMG